MIEFWPGRMSGYAIPEPICGGGDEPERLHECYVRLHLLRDEEVQVEDGVLETKSGQAGSVEPDKASRNGHGDLVRDRLGDAGPNLNILVGQDDGVLDFPEQGVQVVQMVLVGLWQVIQGRLQILLLAQSGGRRRKKMSKTFNL